MPTTPTNHLILRPASLGTFARGCADKSKPAIKLGMGDVFTFKKNHFAVTLVGVLLFAACPLAVFGFVVSAIIDPLDTKSFRSSSHIGSEVFKRVSPPIADGDSAPTIILKVPSVSIVATINNSTPDTIEGVARGLHSVNDLTVDFGLTSFAMTPARSGVSFTNIRESNINSVTTITIAVHSSNSSNPCSLPFGFNNQFSITSSAFYNQFFRHEGQYNNDSPNVNTLLGKFYHFI